MYLYEELKINKTDTINIYRKKLKKDFLRLNLLKLILKFLTFFLNRYLGNTDFFIKIIEHGYTYVTIC